MSQKKDAKNHRDALLSCKDNSVVFDPNLKDPAHFFQELHREEIDMITKYAGVAFKVKPYTNAKTKSWIFIRLIEIYLPDKVDAINFLDNNGPIPKRRARLTIVNAPFNITDYMVGPIS